MKQQKIEKNIVFTDQSFADSYAGRHERYSKKISAVIVRMLSEWGFTSGRILDAGCGPGYEAIALKRAFPKADVTGIDLSQPLLNFARKGAEAAGLTEGLRFETGDVESLPFDDRSFDVVINLFLWNVLKDPVVMCNEIERVLKSDGHLIMMDLRRYWLLTFFESAVKRAYTPSEAFSIIKGTRMRPVKIHKTMLIWCAWA